MEVREVNPMERMEQSVKWKMEEPREGGGRGVKRQGGWCRRWGPRKGRCLSWYWNTLCFQTAQILLLPFIT